MPQRDEVPINWPDSITYLRQPSVSPLISPTTLKTLNKPTVATATYPRLALSSISLPNPRVRITPISDPPHPAHTQHGLIALRPFAPDTFILPYIGHLHSDDPSDTDTHSSYDISIDRELGLAIDAAKAGNEARFINDYRGVSDRPNAEFRDCWVQVHEGRWERWMGVFVLSAGKAGKRKAGIRPGDEILVSYGKGFWKDRAADA